MNCTWLHTAWLTFATILINFACVVTFFTCQLREIIQFWFLYYILRVNSHSLIRNFRFIFRYQQKKRLKVVPISKELAKICWTSLREKQLEHYCEPEVRRRVSVNYTPAANNKFKTKAYNKSEEQRKHY